MVRESRHLWVGNLPEKIQEDDLVKYFERFGRVQGVKLLKDHNVSNSTSSGNSTNASSEPGSHAAAAVAFIDIKSASKAHAAQHSLDGRILKTDYCDAHAHSTSAIHAENNNNNNIANSGKPGIGTGPGGIGTAGAAASGSIDDDRSHTTPAKLSTKIRIRTDSVNDNEGLRGEPSEEESSSHRNNNISPGGASSVLAQISSVPRGKSFKSSSSTSQNSSSLPVGATVMNSSSHNRSSYSRRSTGKSKEGEDRDRRKVRTSSAQDTTSLSERTNLIPNSAAVSENESARNSRESSPGSQENAGSSASSCGRQFVFETLSQDKRPLAICVRNLPSRSSDSSLKDGLFHEYKKYGKIIAVKVQGNGADRYGIICFKRPEDVEKACDMSREKKFFGASVSVSACKEPVDLVDADYRLKDDELDEYHPKATRTLYVGDLDKNVDEEELKIKFAGFGEILDVDIKRQATGSSYAFIQFTDIASVVKALRKMEGCTLSGCRVKLGFGKSMPTTCIWCDNLPDKISERAVIAHFARAGPVRYCSTNRENSQALVFFETVDFAQTAITDLRCKPLQGRRLQLDYASRECQASFFQEMERSGQMTMERKANPFWETISHLGTPVRETFPPFTDARHLINRHKERLRNSRDVTSRVRERPAEVEDSYERELWEYNHQRERRTDKRSTRGDSPPATRENGHSRVEHSDAESITSDQTEHSSNRRFFRNMTPSPPASPSSSRKVKRSSSKKHRRKKSKNYDRTRSVSPSSPISPSQVHSDEPEAESARSPVRRHSNARRQHRSPSHDSFNSQSSPKLRPCRIRHDSGPRTPDSLEELVPESPVATPRRAVEVEVSEAVSSDTKDLAKVISSTVSEKVVADSNTPEVSSSKGVLEASSSRRNSLVNMMETGSDVVTSTVNHAISPTSCHDPVVPSSPDSESSKKSESPVSRRSMGFGPVPDFYQKRIERKTELGLPFCDLLIPEFAYPSARNSESSTTLLEIPTEIEDIPTPPSSPKATKMTFEDRFKALDEKFDKISSVSSVISQITRSISVSESPEKSEKPPLRKRSSDFGMGSSSRSDSLKHEINQRFKSPDKILESEEPKLSTSPEIGAPNTPGPLSNIAKYTANPKFTIRSMSSSSSPEKSEPMLTSSSSGKPVTSDISAKILSITAEASAKFSQHQQNKVAVKPETVPLKMDLVRSESLVAVKQEPDQPALSKSEPVATKRPELNRSESVKTEPISPRKPDSTVSAVKSKPVEKVEKKAEKLVPLEKKKVEKPLGKPAADAGKSKGAGVGFLFREDPNAKMFRGNAPVLSAQQLRQLEKEKAEKEKLERERLEKERIEKERLEKERAERERIEKERLEKERIEKERIERERLEKERAEKARLLVEKQERERLEKERERAEKEKARLAKKAAEEKAAREKAEKERLEKERLEKEERERLEKERLEKERAEKEKERERKRAEVERLRIEAEKEATARAAERAAKKAAKTEKVPSKVEDLPQDLSVKKKKDQLVAEVKPMIPPPKKSLFSSSDEKTFARKAEAQKKTMEKPKKTDIFREPEPEPVKEIEKPRGLALMAKKQPQAPKEDETKKPKVSTKVPEPLPPKKARAETPETPFVIKKEKPVAKLVEKKEEPRSAAKLSKFKQERLNKLSESDSSSRSPSPPSRSPPKAVGKKKWETSSSEASEAEVKQATPPPPPPVAAPKKRGRKPKKPIVEPSSESDSDSEDLPKKNIFEVSLNPEDLQCSMYDKIKRRACTKPVQPPTPRAPSVSTSTARHSVASRDSVKKETPASVKPSRTSSINSSSSGEEKAAKPFSPSSRSRSSPDSDYSQKTKPQPKQRSPVGAKKGRPPGKARRMDSSSESDSSSMSESDFSDFSDGDKKRKQKKTKKREKAAKKSGHKSRPKKRASSSSSSSGSESPAPKKRAATPPKIKPAKNPDLNPRLVESASKQAKRGAPAPEPPRTIKTKAPSRSPSPSSSRLTSPDTKSSSSRPSPPKRKTSTEKEKEKPLPPPKPKEKEKEKPKGAEKEKPKPEKEKPKERIKSPEKEKPSDKLKPRSEDRDDAGGFDGGTYNLSKLMKNTFMDSASRESSVASPAAALTPKPLPPSPKKHKARSSDRSPAVVEVKSPLNQIDQKKIEGLKWGMSPRGEISSPGKTDPKLAAPKVLSPVRSPAKEEKTEKMKPVEKEKIKGVEKVSPVVTEIQRPKAPVYVPPPEEPSEQLEPPAEHNIEEETEAAQMLQDLMDNEPNRDEPVIHIPDGETEPYGDAENELAASIASIEAVPEPASVSSAKSVESPERKRELPPSMYEPMPQPEFRPIQQVVQPEPVQKMVRNENERGRSGGNDGSVNRLGDGGGGNRPGEPSPVIQQKSPLVQQQPQKSPLVPHQQHQPPQQQFAQVQRTASEAMLAENDAKRLKKQRDEEQAQQHLMHQGMPPALFMGMNQDNMHKMQQPMFQQGKMDEQQLMQLHRQQQELNQALLFQSQVGYPPGNMAQSPSFRSAATAFPTSMPGPLRENQPVSQPHHSNQPPQPASMQNHPAVVASEQKEKDRKNKKRKTSSVEEPAHALPQTQPAPPNPPMVSMDHPAARMMMQQMAQQGATFQAQGNGPLLMRFPGQPGLVSFQPFQQPQQIPGQSQHQQPAQSKQPVFGPPPNQMRPPSNIPQQHGNAPQPPSHGMDGTRSGSSATQHRSHGQSGNKPENSVPSPVVNQNQQKQGTHQQMPSPSVPQSPQGMQQPSPQMQQHEPMGSRGGSHSQPHHTQPAHQKSSQPQQQQQQQQMQQHLLQQQQQQLLQQKMQQQQQQQQGGSANQQGQASVIMSSGGGTGPRQLPGVHLQGQTPGSVVINASTGAPMFIPVSQPQQQGVQGNQGLGHSQQQQHHSSHKEASQGSRSSSSQANQSQNQPPPTSHASHRPSNQIPFPHQVHPSNPNLPIDPAHLALFQNLNPADARSMGGAIAKLLQHPHQQNVAEHQKESAQQQQHPHVNRPEPQREKTPIRPSSTVAFSTAQGMMDASAFLPPQFVYGAYGFGAPPGAEGMAAFRPPFMPQDLQQAMQQAAAVQAGMRSEQEKLEQEQRFRGVEGHGQLGHWGAMPQAADVARIHASAPVSTNLPVVWQGTLALKNDHAFVRMHLVSGNQELVRMSLPIFADTSQNILKISQRMRLEAAQLESVSRRMQESQEHCILVACASGKNEADRRQQADMLITGFMTYLQQKQAAGIVNISPPGQNAQPQYVIHIFPPCDFSKRSLAHFGPAISQTIETTPHLFVVITTS